MSLDLENFEEVKIKGEDFYKTLDSVYCPYFKEKISFNVHGINHLKFKEERKARPQQDQYMRLKLIHLAPVVLKASATLQGIWETKSFEKVRIHSRTDIVLTKVTYYEFVAVIDQVRVKVIVKQIDDGEKFFWSIIPYWGVDKNTKKRKLYSGYPRED
ncbi:MAG: hypothetical protein NT041_01060 [Candidatus Vogelbacteria bacterium]|nr:hypothetical protein [Candidatus Vogelbacteria bacterium]